MNVCAQKKGSEGHIPTLHTGFPLRVGLGGWGGFHIFIFFLSVMCFYNDKVCFTFTIIVLLFDLIHLILKLRGSLVV